MKIVLSIATAAMVIAGGAGAMATELPTFDVTGFPISPVQVQVLGAANVREQSPVAAHTPNGQSASPHQMAPRTKRTAAATAPAVTTTGFVAR